MKLKQWLKDHDAWFLGLSQADYQPGYLFRKKHKLFGDSTFVHAGQAWTRLGVPHAEFTPKIVDAGMLEGRWSRTFDGDLGVGLRELAVDVGGSLGFARAITVDAVTVSASTLPDERFDPGLLASKLEQVVQERPVYLAFTMYYATSLRLTFHGKGSVEARVQLPQLAVRGGGSGQWTSANVYEFDYPQAVPFAFQGPKL